jgi:hypothetical protein
MQTLKSENNSHNGLNHQELSLPLAIDWPTICEEFENLFGKAVHRQSRGSREMYIIIEAGKSFRVDNPSHTWWRILLLDCIMCASTCVK